MGPIRRFFERDEPEASYAPLEGGSERPDGERIQGDDEQHEYSRVDYYVFLLLGVAMLWAWYALPFRNYWCCN